MPYQYVTSINRYRNTVNGRFVSRDQIFAYVDLLTDAGADESDILASLIADGSLSPADFGLRMRAAIKDTYIQKYLLGRGGRDLMQPSDWGAVGNMLRDQYAYLDGFVSDLETGDLSEAQISARARLYFQAAREAYERGNATAYGLPRLPAYPGDGSTICVSGCRCRYRYVKLSGDGNVDCYWELDPTAAENCETCIERAEAWSPLNVRGGVLQPYRDIRAHAHHGEHTHA